jgi:arabinose-5-phosphate isomerase
MEQVDTQIEELGPAALVRVEAAALDALAERLEGAQGDVFARAVELLAACVRGRGRVVLTGVGKSGLVARKIAATMVSTGSAAAFLHPTEALHGDLGMLRRGDVVVALSYSGESEELLRLLPVFPKLGVTVVSFCGCMTSSLAKASALVLDVSVEREACAHQLAPTASTTVMLALGDALAVELSRELEFQPQDFAELHPGGQLGRRLARVESLMHSGEAIPVVAPGATMPEMIHEMSAKRLGVTTVQAGGKLLGILSDGDLRRLFEREGPAAFHRTAGEIARPQPRTIGPEPTAAEALALMEAHKITVLLVTEDGGVDSAVIGVLHLHDLFG